MTTPSSDRKLRVFLCHASQDKPVVRELYQRLKAEGWIDPWLDEEKLLPGQDWDMEIEKAVETADVVVVCLSNTSISKEGYIQRELKFALDIALEKTEEAIFVIPLRLDDCKVPRKLRYWQFLDMFAGVHDSWSYQRLIQSLHKRREQLADGEVGFSPRRVAPSFSPDLLEKIKYQNIDDPTIRVYVVKETMLISKKLSSLQLLENDEEAFYEVLDEIVKKTGNDPVIVLYVLGEALDIFQELQNSNTLKSDDRESNVEILNRLSNMLLDGIKDETQRELEMEKTTDTIEILRKILHDFNTKQ